MNVTWQRSEAEQSVTTKIFKSNRSQAVRLPKAVALPDGVSEVTVTVIGNQRIITPVSNTWDDFFESMEVVTNDFLVERSQPEHQSRENL